MFDLHYNLDGGQGVLYHLIVFVFFLVLLDFFCLRFLVPLFR